MCRCGGILKTGLPQPIMTSKRQITAFPREVAENYLAKTKEVLEWLKQDSRLKKS